MAVLSAAEGTEKSTFKKPEYFIAVLVILLTAVSCLFIYISSSGNFLSVKRSGTESSAPFPLAAGTNSSISVCDKLSLKVTSVSIDGNTVTLSLFGENSGDSPCSLSSNQFELNFQDNNDADVHGFASLENAWSWVVPANESSTITQSFIVPTDGDAAYTLTFYSDERNVAGQFYLISDETINNRAKLHE